MRTFVLRGIVLAVLASAIWANAAAAAAGPAIAGSLSNSVTLSGANAVAVSGNFAYEASYWSGQLNVVDISNPATPAIVGSTPPTVSMIAATNVTISGNFAFVTSKNRNASASSNDDGTGNSLTIVDISNPHAPSVVGALHDPTNLFGAYAVAVSGNFAYIASQGLLASQPNLPLTSFGSFSVIDISNKSVPRLAGHIDNSQLSGAVAQGLDHATSVAISGHYAFVTAFYSHRLTTIDISNPAAPIVVHTLSDANTLPAPDDVVINGGYAYVVNQVNSGMQMAAVNISNPLAPTVAATLTDPHLLGAYRVRTRGNLVYVSANSAASVAAIDVSTPGAPRLAASLTDASHLSNVTGLDVSSTGRYIIATSPRLPTNQRPSLPPYPFQAGGPSITGTVSVIDLGLTPVAGAPPRITGTAQQGKTISASTGTWTGALAPSFSYQWQRCNARAGNCKSISGQTKQTYKLTGADVGSRLAVLVTATNSAGSASATSTATKVVTWSSAKFASATLTHSRSSSLGLKLSVPSVGGGVLLQKLAISLPKGLSFGSSHGLVVKSGSGKKLRFKVSLKHGTLTVTLKKPATGVTLTLASITKSGAAKLKSAKLKLNLGYKGKPARRGSIKLRLG